MNPAEIVDALRGEAKDWGCGMATVGSGLLTDAADLIESLTAERDGLQERDNRWLDTFRAIAVDGAGLTDPYVTHDDEYPKDWAENEFLSQTVRKIRDERDGLAGMVLAKDEALLEMTNDAMDNDPRPEPFSPVVQSALYIELPAAAIQVAGWKRKAELADWLASEDTTEINETQSSRGQEAWVVRQLDKLGFWDSLRDEKACSDRYKAAAKEAENANKA